MEMTEVSRSSLRVLIVDPGQCGGATLAMLRIALGLAELGVEVYSVKPSSKPCHKLYAKIFKLLRVEVLKFPIKRFLTWLLLFSKAFTTALKKRVHVIHAHIPRIAFPLYLIARLTGRRFVLTVEGDPLYEIELYRAGLLRRVLVYGTWLHAAKHADAVVGCSNWMRRVLVKRFSVEPSKAYGIPNPVDEPNPKVKPDYSSCRVVCIARLDVVKGVDTLVKAFKAVAEKNPKAKLLLVGDGPLEGDVRALIEELGLQGRVVITGYTDNPYAYIDGSALGVLPSRYEPFGMAAAECMMHGLPVVISDVGGLREVVEDGVSGFKVRPDDPEALAEKMALLLSSRDLAKYGYEAKRRALSLFTPVKVAERYLHVYLKVLQSSA
ncbi:MAG: hypothetical protein DRJ62_06245 [Thermoprotei archaeon]|nr:MAG: hypothetical protein DRJ62_06245 [Thermoprotei archaeon]